MKFFSISKKGQNREHHHDFPEINGEHYQHVISKIETYVNPEWYIEIGSRSGASLARRKCNFIAIDPVFEIKDNVFNDSKKFLFFQQKSDDFFAEGFLKKNKIEPDLAFIDGMHLFEYALRDFINLQSVMAEDGVICIHDVCPFNYEMTTRDVDYLAQGRPWTGDIWKVVLALKKFQPNLSVTVLNCHRTGLAVVKNLSKSDKNLTKKYDEIIDDFINVELQDLGAKEYYDSINMITGDKFEIEKILL